MCQRCCAISNINWFFIQRHAHNYTPCPIKKVLCCCCCFFVNVLLLLTFWGHVKTLVRGNNFKLFCFEKIVQVCGCVPKHQKPWFPSAHFFIDWLFQEIKSTWMSRAHEKYKSQKVTTYKSLKRCTLQYKNMRLYYVLRAEVVIELNE